MKVGGPSFCFNNPPHLVDREEVVCRQCGTLVQDALIGPYQIKRFLRKERRNQAYLAAYQGQTQPVLVKLFPPDPASQHLWARAWQEMRLLADLHHRAILPALNCTVWNPALATPAGFGEEMLAIADNSKAFLVVMYQYVPLTLQHLIQLRTAASPQNTPVTLQRLLTILEQITEALMLAHSLGAVHGGLEPANVLLNAPLNQAWLTDFGLARLQLPQAPFLAPELIPVSKVCEQRRDLTPYWEAISEASDQFTLAVLCYQLFVHAIPPELFQRILPVIQHASQAEPARRFPRVSDFASALAAACGMSLFLRSDPETFPPQHKRASEATSSGSLSAGMITSPGQQANLLEQQAGRHFTSRDYQAARETYEQVLRLEKGRISALLGLADSCFALEKYPEALDAYNKVLELDANNIDAWFNRATVFDLLGHPEQAARGYERAEKLRAEADRRSK